MDQRTIAEQMQGGPHTRNTALVLLDRPRLWHCPPRGVHVLLAMSVTRGGAGQSEIVSNPVPGLFF